MEHRTYKPTKPQRGAGRIFLQKGSAVYFAAFYHRGKEHRESTGERDPEKALKVLADRIKSIHAEEKGGPDFESAAVKKMTVRELLDALADDFAIKKKKKPSAQNLSGIKLCKEAFGDIRATQLRPAHAKRYIKEKLAEGYAPASINRVCGLLTQAFTLAVEDERLSRIPHIQHLSEKGNIRQGFVTKADFMRVLAHLPDDGLRDFCAFAFATGARRGEIAQLDWNNLQDSDTIIRLRPEQCKSEKGRSLPVVGELAEIIKRRREARPVKVNGTTQLSKLVFHRGDGQRIGDFRKTWAKAVKAAKLPMSEPLLFHDLRRSAITAMVNAGVPQLIAMSLSGHETASVFARYTIKVEEEQRNALAATEAYHAKKIKEAEQKATNVVTMAQQA